MAANLDPEDTEDTALVVGAEGKVGETGSGDEERCRSTWGEHGVQGAEGVEGISILADIGPGENTESVGLERLVLGMLLACELEMASFEIKSEGEAGRVLGVGFSCSTRRAEMELLGLLAYLLFSLSLAAIISLEFLLFAATDTTVMPAVMLPTLPERLCLVFLDGP